MVRSSNDVNQGTTADGQRIGRGQSPRSSQEAGNDRGAKGGRNVVWINWQHVSQKGLGSAARLFRPDAPEYRAYQRRSDSQWTACQSGERGESLRGWCDSSQAWSRVPEPVHRYAMNWKAGCRKSARPVWVGGDGGIRSLSTSKWKSQNETPLAFLARIALVNPESTKCATKVHAELLARSPGKPLESPRAAIVTETR